MSANNGPPRPAFLWKSCRVRQTSSPTGSSFNHLVLGSELNSQTEFFHINLMASHQLSNHVRKYRKRSALSQRDVAYLLGVKSGSKVCRYERFTREPGFSTALAYEAIFQVAVSELFPGLYQRIEAGVRARAKRLMGRKCNGKPRRDSIRRRQTLAAIACVDFEQESTPE